MEKNQSSGEFSELQRAGKIRHVGLSNYTAPRLREWFAVAAAEGFVDEIVAPAETRDRLSTALAAFAGGAER